MTDKPDEAERLLAACGKKWPSPPFACLGAAHTDTVLQLRKPAIRNRTNPVRTVSKQPGGVSANIARYLALLGCDVRLYAPRSADGEFDEPGIECIELNGKACDCGYTAVLDPDGELEMGLAAMDDYDDFDESSLPKNFPGKGRGTLVIDGAFKSEMIEAAADKAHNEGWQVMGAGTSPAKVKKLHGVRWDALVLNVAEAEVLAGKKQDPASLASQISFQTGGYVAVTCGADRAYIARGLSVHGQLTPPIVVKNANGAGDAFAATLFACLADDGFNLEVAMRLAASAGSLHAEGRKLNQETIGAALRKKYDSIDPCKLVAVRSD